MHTHEIGSNTPSPLQLLLFGILDVVSLPNLMRALPISLNCTAALGFPHPPKLNKTTKVNWRRAHETFCARGKIEPEDKAGNPACYSPPLLPWQRTAVRTNFCLLALCSCVYKQLSFSTSPQVKSLQFLSFLSPGNEISDTTYSYYLPFTCYYPNAVHHGLPLSHAFVRSSHRTSICPHCTRRK